MYVAWSGQLTLPYLHEFPVVTGLDMCGTFLFGLAFLGLVGAIKHHQVILFFVSFSYTARVGYFIVMWSNFSISLTTVIQYMIILLILFIAQVIVSITCLSMSEEQAKSIANQVNGVVWHIPFCHQPFFYARKNSKKLFTFFRAGVIHLIEIKCVFKMNSIAVHLKTSM